MISRTWVEIDLSALRHNLTVIKERLKGKKLLAVVKADAYGHGLEGLVPVLDQYIDFWGVASLDEALKIRNDKPIVILSPILQPEVTPVVENDFIPTVSSMEIVHALSTEAQKLRKVVNIFVEVDTGMRRTGVPAEKAIEFINDVEAIPNVKIMSIFTHLATASLPEGGPKVLQQVRDFRNLLKRLRNSYMVHIANSAGWLRFPETYEEFDLVRIGILIYGLSPFDHGPTIPVRPILEWKTRIVDIRWVDKGMGVSYDHIFVAPYRMKLATLSVGYGDGYPRSLSNRGHVMIHGKRAPIVGKVCMDLTIVDVTNIPDVKIGDEVTLVGPGITMEEVAKLADTVNYEVATRISPRVPRIYLEK